MSRIYRFTSMLYVLASICLLACAAGGDKGQGGGGGTGGEDTWTNSASASGSSSSSSGSPNCNAMYSDCTDCYKCSVNPANGPCFAAQDACKKDPACDKYWNCLDACNDAVPCMDQCGVTYPNGKPKFDVMNSCYCNDCSSSCGTLSLCTWK